MNAIACITDEIDQDPSIALPAMRRLGIRLAELRNLSGRRIGTVHSREELSAAVRIATDNGVQIAAISPGLSKEPWVPTLRPDLALVARLADTAHHVGARQIICFGFRCTSPAQSPSLQWLCDYFGDVARALGGHDLMLTIENHASCHIATTHDLLQLASAVNLPSFQVNWDPANHFLRLAEVPDMKAANDLVPYLHSVHVKDLDSERRGVTLGRGNLGWKELVATLLGLNYVGRFTLEPHRKAGLESVSGDFGALSAFLNDGVRTATGQACRG